MPDRFGFDHLVTGSTPTVRCIEPSCGVGGPTYSWTRKLRERHWLTHERERRRLAAARARERDRERNARLRLINRLRKEARP